MTVLLCGRTLCSVPSVSVLEEFNCTVNFAKMTGHQYLEHNKTLDKQYVINVAYSYFTRAMLSSVKSSFLTYDFFHVLYENFSKKEFTKDLFANITRSIFFV